MRLGFLRRNVGYKLFALVLSVMLYYVASAQQNPTGVRDQYVQPEIARLPGSLIVAEPPALIPVKVSGKETALLQLDKKTLRATVDGTSVKPGVNRLPVTLSLPPGVTLVNTPPPLATFTAERKEEQPYAVDAMLSGAPPAGQEYGQAIASPGNVVVQGLTADLKRVARVVAFVERQQDEGTVERVVEVYAEDLQKRRVENVEIVPARVTVTAKLRVVPTTKNMVLTVKTVGIPAPGYSVASYEIEPNQLLVRGSMEALSAQSSIAVPVDVTGATETFTKSVTLIFPPGMGSHRAVPPVRVRVVVVPVTTTVGNTEATPAPSVATPAASPAASPSAAPAASPFPAAP